ncbi:hypothetical protein SAMN06265222_104170 [Neorhodopirellula lusitana]|uniref:Uncharacterized protein n=1 Tax=Neorhodopirellula lusitana TaxID=445327 RepID=A0ABY1Q1D0_9BACT|nr:hypothetical protein SAMN06265222_104170 [Neorhodopirellula lusitana]
MTRAEPRAVMEARTVTKERAVTKERTVTEEWTVTKEPGRSSMKSNAGFEIEPGSMIECRFDSWSACAAMDRHRVSFYWLAIAPSRATVSAKSYGWKLRAIFFESMSRNSLRNLGSVVSLVYCPALTG